MPRIIHIIGSALILTLASGERSAAQQMTGTFRGGPDGRLVLTLADLGSSYVGRLTTDGRTVFDVEGTRSVDEDGEIVVEGSVVGGAVADFELGWDPEDSTYSLFLTPYDPSGTPRLDLASLSMVERISGAAELEASAAASPSDATPPPDPPPGPPSTPSTIDPGLVGTWATQVVMSTPGGSVATRISMRLEADGTMIDLGSRAMGGFPDADLDVTADGADRGRWRVQNGVLLASYQGSAWVPMARYRIQGSSLLLTFADGSTQLWERAR